LIIQSLAASDLICSELLFKDILKEFFPKVAEVRCGETGRHSFLYLKAYIHTHKPACYENSGHCQSKTFLKSNVMDLLIILIAVIALGLIVTISSIRNAVKLDDNDVNF